ncbi:MAG: IclR family transcriptional regulator [Microbacteriaceae bacterium]
MSIMNENHLESVAQGEPVEYGTPRLASLALGLEIIDLLIARDQLTVTQVAESLGVPRSRAHRSLTTLVSQGYALPASAHKGYVAGPKILRLSGPQAMGARSRFRLRPVLQDIFEATGEAVHSSVLLGRELLVVDGRRSRYVHDIGLRVGMIAPAHAMAGGKLLLSYLSEQQLHSLYPEEELPRRGPQTLSTRRQLQAELKSIRRQGYSQTVQESESGVNSIGMLLSGNSWRSRTAVVVSVPIERGSPNKLAQIRQAMFEILERRNP